MMVDNLKYFPSLEAYVSGIRTLPPNLRASPYNDLVGDWMLIVQKDL